jgi:hypothetical protein
MQGNQLVNLLVEYKCPPLNFYFDLTASEREEK